MKRLSVSTFKVMTFLALFAFYVGFSAQFFLVGMGVLPKLGVATMQIVAMAVLAIVGILRRTELLWCNAGYQIISMKDELVIALMGTLVGGGSVRMALATSNEAVCWLYVATSVVAVAAIYTMRYMVKHKPEAFKS